MSLVGAGYGSDGSDSGSDGEPNPFDVPNEPIRIAATTADDSDSEEQSEEEEPAGPSGPIYYCPPVKSSNHLPNPMDVLQKAKGPDFLNPEATRPIAELYHQKPPAKIWEKHLTPEEARAEMENNKRKAAVSGGVVSGKAVLYRDKKDEDESSFDSSKIDPLALAMLGVAPAKKLKHAVVLGSGEKGAVKEREKQKRVAGQNGRESVTWKSEEEMILRQQFDS